MKTASQLFCLAVFALLHTSTSNPDSEAAAQSIIPETSDVCAINPKAIVSDACASYSTLESLNHEIRPFIEDLTKHTDFFSYYRLNLFNKHCPFWSDDSAMCGNIACAVATLDNEDDIPLIWRSEELSKLEGPKAGHPGKKQQAERGPERPLQGMLGEDTAESCVVEYDDECDERDYCVPEDESASGKGDYVSLVDNPERFTGYMGPSANQVWDAIYRENCFSRTSFPPSLPAGGSLAGMSLPAATDLKFVMQGGAQHQPQVANAPSAQTGFENEDECLEKRVFYRVVSGMHASISTHICWETLNRTTGEWGPSLGCYKARLHTHPERVANLYFDYALVARAVAKLGPHLADYTFCKSDAGQDAETRRKVLAITGAAASGPQIFDESLMFVNGEGPSLKEDFRNRFRNVSRLMDCVGCDKCRLWGKLQTAGYGTALKVLFEFDGVGAGGEMAERPRLKRTEIVALFNTLGRLSSSLSAIEAFRDMVEAEEHANGVELEGKHYHKITDRERMGRQVVPGAKYDPALSEEENRKQWEEKGKDSDVDVDIDEDVYDFLEQQRKRRDPANETVLEALRAEIYIVWRVVLFVFRQWIGFPRVAWGIFLNEMSRFWNFYIGLPVPPRTWGWRAAPPLDEL